MKKMGKKWAGFFSVLLAAMLVTACGAGGQGGTSVASGEPYKIGANLSLTGPAAWLGTNEKRAIDLYVEEVNKKGGINGHPVKVVYFDNESKPDVASQGAKKLISEDKVIMILGGSGTPDSIAISQVAIPNKVPMISLSGGYVPDPEKDWSWATAHATLPVTKFQFEELKKAGIKRVAILLPNDALGQIAGGAYDKVKADYPDIQVVARETINLQDLDIKAQLNNIKSKNPEIVLAFVTGEPAVQIRKQMNEVGLNVPMIGPHSSATREFIKLIGNVEPGKVMAVAGKIADSSSVSPDDPQKPVIDEFVSTFGAKYGYTPGYIEGFGYDAIRIAVAALKEVGPDREKIKDFINNLKNFPGALGMYNVDPKNNRTGLSYQDLILVEINNGKWQKVENLKARIRQ